MFQHNFKGQYGPWALVTGASSGLGRAVALRLSEQGLDLVIHGRHESALQDVAKQITNNGQEAKIITDDALELKNVKGILGQTEDIDIGLFVAAAGYRTSGGFIKNSMDDELDMLGVNVRAVVQMPHYFAQKFKKKKRGGIMLFSSLLGFRGTPFAANYAATKAYVQVLREGLHHEMKSYGVDVLYIAPGPVATEFGARADMKMNRAADPKPLFYEMVKDLGRKQILKPGFLSKFLLFNLSYFPRWARVRIMSIVMGSMTKHQRS